MNCLLCLYLLTSAALAHPLAGEARAIEEQALVLRQKMGPENPNLSWGQKMAVDDMGRLATAASAVRQVTESEEVDWENTRSTFMELEVASNRVRMSLPVSTLDEEGQKVGQQMVAQVEEIDKAARGERDQNFSRQVAASRPTIGFGMGFGSYWGRPWYGYGMGFPVFLGGYRGGFGGFRGRCR
ncbi:hypothetical protein JST97_04945 [bacterium]|nr:hypothetical protein [bacterium]